jgi:hypothetical protein
MTRPNHGAAVNPGLIGPGQSNVLGDFSATLAAGRAFRTAIAGLDPLGHVGPL